MKGKVSIIIPIYNAEEYLPKCIDSVINQTLTNLQIILVNDGSSDTSGRICDDYAAIDSRIYVIHKENGGVSAARNAGLKVAEGEWIGFVDADDWIEQDMYAYLVENADFYSADIAICSLWEETPGKQVTRGVDCVSLLTKSEAMERLLRDDQINNFMWNKLWKKELFDSNHFPEGRNYEDVAIAYKLFQQASKVICLPEQKYHYRQHRNSILDNHSLKNKIDLYYAAKDRMDELQIRWNQYSEVLQASCVSAAVGVWACYCFNSRAECRKYKSLLREIADFAKGNRFLVYKHLNLGFAGKIIVMLTAYPHKWAFLCAGIIGIMYRQKHGRSI